MDERSAYVRQFWEDRGRRVDDSRLATRFRVDDAVEHDLALVRRFCTPDTRVLDLGAGTCVLSRLLAPHVSSIVAVDFVADFFGKDPLPANVSPVVSDIRSFHTTGVFDLVLLFGVLTYVFDEDEVASIYERAQALLAPGGMLIVKHQVGVSETVLIDHISQEFGTRYAAIYRDMDSELHLLNPYFDVQVVDIYPSHLNRWDNTHFYAFICRPRVCLRADPLEIAPRAEDKLLLTTTLERP